MLALAVEVAGDRPGADVDALAHRGVAQVAEVHHLAARAEGRTVHFAPRPHTTAAAAVGAGADMGERSNGNLLFEGSAVHKGGQDAAALAQDAIPDDGVGAQDALPAHHRAAVEMGVGQDDAVRPHLHPGVDVGGGGVLHGDPTLQEVVHHPAPQGLLRLGQLQAGVDPHRLRHVVQDQRPYSRSLGDGDGGEGGQVQLPVGRRLHPGQARPEPGPAEGAEAAVDFGQAALLVRGVPVLDDLAHLVPGAHDAPVPGRVAEVPRGQGQGGRALAVPAQEALHGARLQEGGVPEGHHHRLRALAHGLPGHGGGVPRAELGLLQHEAVGVRPEQGLHGLPYGLRAVSQHDHRVPAGDAGLVEGDQDVPQHGLPGDLVQHLVALGAHAGALAPGEDDGRRPGAIRRRVRSRHAGRRAVRRALRGPGRGWLATLGHVRRTALAGLGR